MRDPLQRRIESVVDGEVGNDDWAEVVSGLWFEFLDGGVGCDYLGFLFRSDSIAHVVASLERSKKDAETNEAAGAGDGCCERVGDIWCG